MRAFDVSMYLSARGEQGSATVDGVSKTARQAPANLTPVYATLVATGCAHSKQSGWC